MEEGWNKFWEKRVNPLSDKQRRIFQNNFFAMYAFIINHAWENGRKENPSSLEIGCGRATISDYLVRVGFDTWTMDKKCIQGNKHVFIEGDVLNRVWPNHGSYDVILSYGLLEHFTWDDQKRILNNCVKYLAPRGMQVHYVVPRKLSNIFEDRNVYRDPCEELITWFDTTWVYPIIGKKWVTNKYIGKAFIITAEKFDEDFGISDRKVTKH